MFEELNQMVGTQKKIDYYKLSKGDLITLLKLSNQQLQKANTKILELQVYPQTEKQKEQMLSEYEKQMRQKDL